MEPINTRSVNTLLRSTPIKSSSAEPINKAVNHTSGRPEFVSPKGSLDAESGIYVTQIRNASTEMLNFQYPNKKAVAEYVRSDNLVPAAETKSQVVSSTPIVSGDVSEPVGVASSTPPTSSGQTTLSSSSVNPLGTTDND